MIDNTIKIGEHHFAQHIYIHIPFCKQACNYCDFYFTTQLKSQEDALVETLIKEIDYRSNYLKKNSIQSIYFGGGTPSLLHASSIKNICKTFERLSILAPNAEVNIELNPDDINPDKISFLKDIGFNRLSIGIQSFFDQDLLWMHRSHNTAQAYKAIEVIKKSAFNNFSIDLIFGYGLLTDKKWESNLETFINFSIPHLSCYGMTVEPGTAYHKKIILNKEKKVSPAKQARQFLMAKRKLEAIEMVHYEVSNYALSGFQSLHNWNYWNHKPYIGIGPSAHSFIGNKRWWNIANLKKYIAGFQQNKPFVAFEKLDNTKLYNEYAMLKIRTKEGIVFKEIKNQFGVLCLEHCLKCIDRIDKHHIHQLEGGIRLTAKGLLWADNISSRLMIV